jgi:hypothetical protein
MPLPRCRRRQTLNNKNIRFPTVPKMTLLLGASSTADPGRNPSDATSAAVTPNDPTQLDSTQLNCFLLLDAPDGLLPGCSMCLNYQGSRACRLMHAASATDPRQCTAHNLGCIPVMRLRHTQLPIFLRARPFLDYITVNDAAISGSASRDCAG